MSLSNEERNLIIDHITNFATNMFESANDEHGLTCELDRFLNFFCGALEAAHRDGRREALTTTLN